jgi:hypothetical protein
MMPQKAGGLAARNVITGSGVAAATGQSGYNIDATITGAGDIPNTVSIGLIVSIIASIAGSGGVTAGTMEALASMVAEITGSSSVTATAQGLADLAASLYGDGSVDAGNTALMDIASTIRGYGDLTPEGIRDNVWNALLTNYQGDGSAGKALATASSGGVDLNLMAQAVWEYVSRTLTSGGGGATPEDIAAAILAAAQVTPIHSEVKKVNGVTISGSGIPPTFDENGVMTDPGDPWGVA